MELLLVQLGVHRGDSEVALGQLVREEVDLIRQHVYCLLLLLLLLLLRLLSLLLLLSFMLLSLLLLLLSARKST